MLYVRNSQLLLFLLDSELTTIVDLKTKTNTTTYDLQYKSDNQRKIIKERKHMQQQNWKQIDRIKSKVATGIAQ